MFRAIFCPKHVELILQINKSLLHLVGSSLLLYLVGNISCSISIFSVLCSKFLHKQISLLNIYLSLSDFDRNWKDSTNFFRPLQLKQKIHENFFRTSRVVKLGWTKRQTDRQTDRQRDVLALDTPSQFQITGTNMTVGVNN